ncbi:MAG: DUF1289 domain-containing protein [Planctomycetes bacterium]|nr:DUF1289 domain-containing protein [Planctomycetota bacterium]
MSETSQPPASPCIRVCELDATGRLCTGCMRTVEEIAAWSGLDDAAKREVLERAKERRAARRERR